MCLCYTHVAIVKDIDLGLEVLFKQDKTMNVSVLGDEETLLELGKQISVIFARLVDLLRNGTSGFSRKELDMVIVGLRLNAEEMTKLIRHNTPLTIG